MWGLLAALGLTALVVFLIIEFPDRARDEDTPLRLVYGGVWLALIGSAVIVHFRAQPGLAIRQAAAWIAIAGVIFIGYSFRHELSNLGNRLGADLIPGQGRVSGDGSLILTAQRNGHFTVKARVDGVDLQFLIDTGASDVTLNLRDARRLGIDISRLNFNRPYRTANGVVYGAPITLREMAVGPIVLQNVRASVNQAELSGSLLGMSFLSRLSGYEVNGDRLTLRR